ncbi:hypothetical protein HPP92_022402 [Vanilla planifolia]|uniref:Uncharacterized protein n=1 Tax=Vanilla planifolia TaxID=51239 RepID=A0A835PRG2_VANPL|nr:hypothetical protein HPP92_022402 [Vanilla planifolia]
MEAFRKLREQVARQQQVGRLVFQRDIMQDLVQFDVSSKLVSKDEMIMDFVEEFRRQSMKALRPIWSCCAKAIWRWSIRNSENLNLDEAEVRQCHRLEKLYTSTRSCKHFQRDIVRSLEGYIVTGSKQVEIGTKLAEDSRKYGAENTCTSGNALTKAAFNLAKARAQMLKEHEHLLRVYGTQV